jgi:hypothetical protein
VNEGDVVNAVDHPLDATRLVGDRSPSFGALPRPVSAAGRLILQEDRTRRERPRADQPQVERSVQRPEQVLAGSQGRRDHQPTIDVDEVGLGERREQVGAAA